ncbi:MAG TPA: secondary thiamine-phosphate synthase enzyme YjbQ [Crinalium sp.]|jgi:secondary thiamine-phosphate synthase enzyme
MLKKISLPTHSKTEIIDITPQVQEAVTASGIAEGICIIYVPHTTAGVLIQENADPNVHTDLLNALDRLVPKDLPYLHQTVNKNAPSHIKASLIGPSKTVFVCDGELQLGRYQFVYVCEFDGPRSREVWVRILKDA